MRRRMDAVLALKNSISANRVGALPGSRREETKGRFEGLWRKI